MIIVRIIITIFFILSMISIITTPWQPIFRPCSNINYLTHISFQLILDLFGTFFGNSYKQRIQEMKVTLNTQSIWSYVNDFKERFCNDHFFASNFPIWPSSSMAKMVNNIMIAKIVIQLWLTIFLFYIDILLVL